MRKFLAFLFSAAEFASMAVAGYYSYSAYKGEMSFELGVLLFIPLMIMSYWFSTFYYHLSHPRHADGSRSCILNKRVCKILSTASSVVTFALMFFWIYMFLWQNGYTTFYFGK